MTKRCSSCGQDKQTVEFYPRRYLRSTGTVSNCRTCSAVIFKAWREKNPEKNCAATMRWCKKYPNKKKHLDKRTKLAKHYGKGVTPEFKDTLIAKQGGCCAICCKPFDQTARKNACLDHIHGQHGPDSVRAILCVPCNAGLGNFYENPDLLQAAIDYLEEYA